MDTLAPLIIGVIIGFGLGWLVAWLRAGKRPDETVRLQTQLEERDRRLAELTQTVAAREAALNESAERRAALEAQVARAGAERDALIEARQKLEETFKALAGESLRASGESFLNLARSQIETLLAKADGTQEKRKEELEKLVAPLSESLKRYEGRLGEMEKARSESYAGLRERAEWIVQSNQDLKKETSNLVQALRRPQTRGRWGEMTLKRAVELAGLSEHCDFSEQVSVDTPDGEKVRQRPDMIVHLPADRDVVVDAKVSLAAYLEAVEAGDEATREEKLKKHATQVRQHMEKLASKDYTRQFEKAPEFTVLFLPGEPFLGAAAQHDLGLIEDGMERRILIATPTTLIALLLAVAHGWRQAAVEENARDISRIGREVYERIVTLLEHVADTGSALRRAMDSHNRAIRSFGSRLEPSIRRLRELAAPTAPEPPALESLDEQPQPFDRRGGSPEAE